MHKRSCRRVEEATDTLPPSEIPPETMEIGPGDRAEWSVRRLAVGACGSLKTRWTCRERLRCWPQAVWAPSEAQFVQRPSGGRYGIQASDLRASRSRYKSSAGPRGRRSATLPKGVANCCTTGARRQLAVGWNPTGPRCGNSARDAAVLTTSCRRSSSQERRGRRAIRGGGRPCR